MDTFFANKLMSSHQSYRRSRYHHLFCDTGYKTINSITTNYILTAQPVWLDTDISFLALEMIRWTRPVVGTNVVTLIGSLGVFAIINSVTDLRFWNTLMISARELSISTGRVF